MRSSHPQPAALGDFVTAVLPAALPAGAERLLVATAAAGPLGAGAGPASAALKATVVRAVARMEGGAIVLGPTLTPALQKLLADPATAAAVLPIIAKWDTRGVLRAAADQRAKLLLADISRTTVSDDRRVDAAAGLLAVPARRADAIAAVAPLLVSPAVQTPLKARFVATLGDHPGADADAALINALARTNSTLVFDQLMRRPESAQALLAAMKQGQVTPANLGPSNVARLRTHPNRPVATAAAALLDTLSPAARPKSDIIATLAPEVEKPGDASRGRTVFTGTCSGCHKFGDIGRNEAGPPLNGMGAHGRAELLAHILDPNREVDPSFWQWNVTTRRGETLAGVIASENAAGLTLRNAAGDVEVKKDDIVTRENTRRSLMPEGLEAMGAESLRDLLTFMVGGEQRFRVVDLRQAYTADSRRGFRREDERDETVTLQKFGDVTVAGVPFFVMDPARSPNGANLVALRGGPGRGNVADDFPMRIEIPASVTAASLHFLGGVGGWAWPTGGDATRGTPVLKVTVQFADGSSQEHVLRNGEYFADAFAAADVPRSAAAAGFTRRGQVRYFALNLGKSAQLSRIVLESYDNDIVPATIAITAGTDPVPGATSGGSAAAPAQAQAGAPVQAPPGRAGSDARPQGRREGRRPASGNEADRLGRGQDQSPHHRRRQLARLRQVLRRYRPRHARGGRLQRQLHGGSRSGGRRDRTGRRRGD